MGTAPLEGAGLMTILSLLLGAVLATSSSTDEGRVVVVVGAEGTSEFGAEFQEAADAWQAAAQQAQLPLTRIGSEAESEDSSDLQQLESVLQKQKGKQPGTLWLVLIGHGTFDGETAKFNLRGPDLSAGQLKEWLAPIEQTVAVINCSSCSGPFINQLTGPDRVIVTATKSGTEHNYSRFAKYMSRSIADPEADLDKDGQTSLLEAYLSASHAVQEFYQQETRLATEHALLDDNGDGLGTPADWFRGIHAIRAARSGSALDGLRSHQLHLVRSAGEQQLPAATLARRDQLEAEIAHLREQKTQLSADDYYSRLEPLMLELARLYQQETPQASPGE
jgi:hypothetical protein